jgi:cyclophilin family peptidyl-prolyl cis-trans isomerase/HEAT repeat protein
MKRLTATLVLSLTFTAFFAYSQKPDQTIVPQNIGIQILRAEDARRYDAVLEKLLADRNGAIRKRATLAAGRIGSENAIPTLTSILEKGTSEDVHAMAVFAIGEIESIKGADTILNAFKDPNHPEAVRARLVEAAGKIVAANPKDEKAKALGDAVLNVLTNEEKKQSAPSTDVIRLGLTAVLSARPAGAEEIVRKFLAFSDPNVVADALNTLARLRAKNANRDARDLLETNVHAVVRANAARVLGAAEDKEAVDILLKAAIDDSDSRVRVSAIRALGNLKQATAAHPLIVQFRRLLVDYSATKRTRAQPNKKNEILEIATTLGKLLANTNDTSAVDLLRTFREFDKYSSPETEIAFARIAPKVYVDSFEETADWKSLSAQYQGLAELANLDALKEPDAKLKARLILVQEIAMRFTPMDRQDIMARARPDLVRSFAVFKSENTSNIFRPLLEVEKDIFVRAAIAETLADQPSTKENMDELKTAFSKALVIDKKYDDAQLAILDALFKLDKKESVGTLLIALSAPDYLVRKKAFELLSDKDLQRDFPGLPTSLENARAKHKDQVLPYSPAFGTKLGQVLNTDADYRRALSRKNGKVKAILTTEKGTFTIDLLPENAPLTVDNFIKLANSRYFNGTEVHRVVPNFVMQDGDPRGDGNGGPGWSIRCEINMVPYERGAVGMALSGKDTGGSQWFVTHSPQPHLDGGYTAFGRVNETGMKIVDNIVRGDKVLTVRIVEGNSRPRPQRIRRSGQNRER